MAKHSQPINPSIEATAPSENGARIRKRLKRLERDLAERQATETKRRQQLEEARTATVAVRRELAALRAELGVTTPAPALADGPIGYCMREKRAVQISAPTPVTLSNGRAAIAGVCPTCGARVMVLAARPASIDD